MLITAAITPRFTDEVQKAIHALDFFGQVHREWRRGPVIRRVFSACVWCLPVYANEDKGKEDNE